MESVRPLLARLVPLALLTLTLVALLPDCASACSCGTLPGTPREVLSDSKTVFAGKVVSFEKPPPDTTMIEGTMFSIMGGFGRETPVTLHVSEVWKGPRQQTIEITTEADSSVGCGYPFEEGREYLVYASKEDPAVSLCSETKPLSGADADLKALGNGEAPVGGGVLSDTSGSVPARAVVALAALAATVSFVLAAHLLRTG